MTALRLPALRLAHGFAAGAALLAGLALWPWLVAPPVALAPLAARPPAAPAAAPPALRPLADYAAIVERPLFSPSRRPTPGVAAAAPATGHRFRLIGIVGTGAMRKAFVADGGRRAEIVAGDTLDGGWTVKEIAPDRVLLSSPAGEAVLRLTQPAAAETAKPQ